MSARKSSSAPKDWSELGLGEGGRSLIEASAGTGKTWTISVLYLRLLLEREPALTPRQIVVTTFTDPAAQELKEKLRGKLEWAVLQAETPIQPDVELPPDEAWLRGRWGDDATRIRDLARLRLALAEMDIAPISTLHSLCRRILTEYPFACGVPFEMGELVSGTTLLDEVSEDLWRRFQQGETTDELVSLQALIEPGLTLSRLKSILSICLMPGAVVEPGESVDIDELLPVEWAARLSHLLDKPGVFDRRSVQLQVAWRRLAGFISDRTPFLGGDDIDKLLAADELKGVLKDAKNDEEVLAAAGFSVEIAPRLRQYRDNLHKRFWKEAAEFARSNVQARLQSRNQLTFDELLSRVSGALERESKTTSRPLADALFSAWPVALVDEFQDTDGQQYGILDAIYRESSKAKRGRLVMIGDPKQAIYRFRGGDIHAYQRAASEADLNGRLTLGTNHRSSRTLVEAFNQFYEAGGSVLSARDDEHPIRYEVVAASSRQDATPYRIDGEPVGKPLQIHFNPEPEAKVGDRRAHAFETCADQIATMVRSDSHRIGDARVQPSDIAVLLPTARDVIGLRDCLSQRGIPCVTTTRSSVFQTDIARELHLVLYAVAYPRNLRALRAAVSTRLWGGTLSLLQRREKDVASWQEDVDLFHRWHEMWNKRGLQAVVERLLAHMAPRYLETVSGERAVTDLRHLGELLQAQSELSAGKEELLAWFNAARDTTGSDGGEAADATQLRIESDGACVRLMTLHASKGLEFPIVFLPLMWDHTGKDRSLAYVISDKETGKRTIEFSGDAKYRQLEELQDERFRILYVALTRAVHACHVFTLPPNTQSGKQSSDMNGPALDVMLERGWESFQSGACSRIGWINGWLSPTQEVAEQVELVDVRRRARALPPEPTWTMEGKHSFSTLMSGRKRSIVELETSVISQADQVLQALDVVRGNDFGNAVHDIFERRLIGEPLSSQHSLIREAFARHSVRYRDINEAEIVERVANRLQGALEAPLGLVHSPGTSLADLPAEKMRAEIEFYFPVDDVALNELREVCRAHGEPDLIPGSRRRKNARGRVMSGLMNGKIDLTFEHDGRFHVLDYKSNFLGDAQGHTLAHYQGEHLLKAMDGSFYRFQALIYTVALDRYLANRLGRAYDRSRHLGESVYLYVRAAGLAPGAGIWRQRFPDALLTAVADVLNGTDEKQRVA